MKNTIKIAFLFLFISICSISNAQVEMNTKFDTPYGNNTQIGKYASINGANIYYEEYGKGEPMFLIHGNGADIKSMGNQIDYFKTKYRVIIADSRGHGKSELKTDSLTYVQMANDWAKLATHLKLDSLNVIGWSDGGIVGLLLGIHHPKKVKKIVTMGANLRPDSTAVYSWAIRWVNETKSFVGTKIKDKDTSENWGLSMQHLNLLGNQPNITHSDLSKINAPVLIVAGDKDIIREEHSVEIYQNIRNAQLCILPGETHFTPASNPEVFNQMANNFISKPFKRPDSNWTKK
jgi:pimeloyl-ACP methyl ester carboxylesterase